MKKQTVLIQGAFDIINYGHIKALTRAKSEGNHLIVALNTDELLKKYKGKTAVLPFYQKKFILEAIRPVDKVIPAKDFSPIKLLKKHAVDVYCYTKEWEESKTEEILYMLEKGGRCVVLPRYKHVIPTSGIKKALLLEAKKEEKKKKKKKKKKGTGGKLDFNLPENRERLEKVRPIARIIGNLNRN